MAEEAKKEKSPTELVIDQLQHLGLIIESNIFLLQAVGDQKVLTKDELKTLLLTGQELADKVDQFTIYVTHQLAQIKS